MQVFVHFRDVCRKPLVIYLRLSFRVCNPGGGGGGYSGFYEGDGDDRMELKVKTQKKSLRLPAKPKKIPGPKINPPKFHAFFVALLWLSELHSQGSTDSI